MQKRILILPLVWGAYGIGEVFVLNYLFGSIVSNIPFTQDDKPIGGSYLPALFFNIAALLAIISLSLYATGVWTVDLSSPKVRRDIAALGVLLASGFLVFYYPIFLFPLVVALVYFLATNIE